MACCMRPKNSPFVPLVNDCHNWADNCLKKYGLNDPQMPRFNDDFWNRISEGVDKGLQ